MEAPDDQLPMAAPTMHAPTLPRRILLTGAAGRIGTAFRLAHGQDYRFRLADLETSALTGTPGKAHEVIRLDVADARACHAACAGTALARPWDTGKPCAIAQADSHACAGG